MHFVYRTRTEKVPWYDKKKTKINKLSLKLLTYDEWLNIQSSRKIRKNEINENNNEKRVRKYIMHSSDIKIVWNISITLRVINRMTHGCSNFECIAWFAIS